MCDRAFPVSFCCVRVCSVCVDSGAPDRVPRCQGSGERRAAARWVPCRVVPCRARGVDPRSGFQHSTFSLKRIYIATLDIAVPFLWAEWNLLRMTRL